jgi:hypothetical protein
MPLFSIIPFSLVQVGTFHCSVPFSFVQGYGGTLFLGYCVMGNFSLAYVGNLAQPLSVEPVFRSSGEKRPPSPSSLGYGCDVERGWY